MSPTIRPATNADFGGIWAVFEPVVRAGDTYPYATDTTKDQARRLWFAPSHRVYVATLGQQIVGTYYLRPNQPTLGAHVANAGYMVHPDFRQRGIGRAMGLHSIEEAKRLGYAAMQFNLVVATNAPSVELWKQLGFTIIGTVPKAFRHATAGLVDAHIMHRFLATESATNN